MSRLSWLQKLYWTRFGQPANERALFRSLIERPYSSVLELGVGDGNRMQRIAKLLQLPEGVEQLRYVGLDEFESAKDNTRHLRLKQAHQLATQLGFKASLIPGDHPNAIPRAAHKMVACDLIVVDGGLDPAQPTSGFIGQWLDRLVHERSVLIACAEPGQEMKRVDLAACGLSNIRHAA